jgi:hypothetical protein
VAIFVTEKVMLLKFAKKTVCATLCAIFSQKYLATLNAAVRLPIAHGNKAATYFGAGS